MIEFMTVYFQDELVTKVLGNYDGPDRPEEGEDIKTAMSTIAKKNWQFMMSTSEDEENCITYRNN